jgi:MraZ protein
MFLGEYEHTIDEKARLAIPARFRSELAEGLFLTRGLDRCLVIWSPESWRAISERLKALPLMQANARRIQRLFFSGAVNTAPDKLGRIVIPAYLRSYAELQSDVVVVGLLNRAEIWSKALWSAERASAEAESAELAEHLSSLGI